MSQIRRELGPDFPHRLGIRTAARLLSGDADGWNGLWDCCFLRCHWHDRPLSRTWKRHRRTQYHPFVTKHRRGMRRLRWQQHQRRAWW